MIITISNLVSELIQPEIVSYISKLLENQYIKDESETFKNEIIKLLKEKLKEKEKELPQLKKVHRLLQESIEKDIYYNGRSILQEVYMKIDDIDSTNLLSPTFVKLTVGLEKDNYIDYIIGVKCISNSIGNMADVYAFITKRYKKLALEKETYTPGQRKKEIFIIRFIKGVFNILKKFLKKKYQEMIYWIRSSNFDKIVRYTWLKYFSDDPDVELIKHALKPLYIAKGNKSITLSISDLNELTPLEAKFMKIILKEFQILDFHYFVIDDPANKKVYIWNLKIDLNHYYSITYDMMYSSLLRKTAEDMDRIKKANQNLFSIRRSTDKLPIEVGKL